MSELSKNRYMARTAMSDEDVRDAQQLRAKVFGASVKENNLDQDMFDAICTHILVEDTRNNQLVCCFRMLPLTNGGEIERCYSAQFYDLSTLITYNSPMVEIGRFCIFPGLNDPDILRVAFGAMTRYVDENKVKILFGCSSFDGTDTGAYLDAFTLLKDRYLAPQRWLPRVKAPDVFRFAQKLGLCTPNAKRALAQMPPLLRTYLAMGGWVSDHAVVDQHLGTLHVFTALEIDAIPAARKRLLRAAVQ